jgi:predicted nuclease of predicted toxin-antitoxin system
VKFKLDENIGTQGQKFLASAGHDVSTVREEELGGEPDHTIFRGCQAEGRALITLDHDFGNVLRFPPRESSGLVILELPPHTSPDALLTRLREFLAVLESRPLRSELWIVEPGRVRIHQDDAEH